MRTMCNNSIVYILKTGAFGTVYRGTITVKKNNSPSTLIDVAVKTIKAGTYIHTCLHSYLLLIFPQTYVKVYLCVNMYDTC